MRGIELHLDRPPSANGMTRFGNRTAFSSKAYRKWLEAAAWEVKLQRKGRVFVSPVSVQIAVPPHKDPRADLDNYSIAQTFDALQKGGLITNDKIIHHFSAEWLDLESGKMSVVVRDIKEWRSE